MDNIQKQGVIALIKSAFTGKACELPEDFSLKSVIPYAKKSQTSAILFYGAEKCSVSINSEAMQELFMLTCASLTLCQQQIYEFSEITKAFDEKGIEYMPLKGIKLKQMYPDVNMRTMSDIDILIKTEQYDLIKPILYGMGYVETTESDHELNWQKDNICLELHKRMISTYNKDFYGYFGDGWELAKREEGQPNRYKMTPEDTYIYLFTHLVKHYRSGGIGIKHMTDLWVYLSANPDIDMAYVREQLEKLHLLSFYENVSLTLDTWFGDGKETEITSFITDVIFESDSYGNHKDHVAALMIRSIKTNGKNKSGAKREILKTLFLPYRFMREKYPVLNKLPFLLPVFWIVRGFGVLFSSPGKIKKFGNDAKLMSEENVEKYYESLKYVGLDYYYGDNL